MDIKMDATYNIYNSARRKNYVNKLEFVYRSEADILTYYVGMANAITGELQKRGHCWLIDQALSCGYIFSVDMAIIHALSNAQRNGGQLQLLLPAVYQLLPIDDTMEQTMLALYAKPSSAAGSSVSENRNSALSSEADELARQLEQTKLMKLTLENQISQLKKESEQLKLQMQETRSSIEKQLSNAQFEAEAIVRSAREKAGSIRVELLHGAALDEEQGASPVQPNSDSLRDLVGTETLRLETTVRTTLDAYRDEIHKMLYEFRTGLYKSDYASLCFAYQKLYLFATTLFDSRIESICSALCNEELALTLQNSLRKVQGQLIKRTTGIEDSLTHLGLTVYRPEAGEKYNAVNHAAENAEDDGYLEATVRCCICPGVRAGDQILCRATVLVDTPENS